MLNVFPGGAVGFIDWLGFLCSISLRDEPLIPFLHPRPKCPAEKKTDKRPTARLTKNHCGGYRIVPGGQYKNRDDERRECEHQQPILQDEFCLAPFTHNFPALETSWHFLAHRSARSNEKENEARGEAVRHGREARRVFSREENIISHGHRWITIRREYVSA